MKKVAIVTDSNAGIRQKEAKELLIKDVKFDIKCYIYLQEFAKSGNKMFK